ncbi:MAG TPA: hypothetical protein VNY52_09430 [Solirubrobacteraceae bacterium]|nr:hypothetical protein [Solirubrobacteraceae bacterium]
MAGTVGAVVETVLSGVRKALAVVAAVVAPVLATAALDVLELDVLPLEPPHPTSANVASGTAMNDLLVT